MQTPKPPPIIVGSYKIPCYKSNFEEVLKCTNHAKKDMLECVKNLCEEVKNIDDNNTRKFDLLNERISILEQNIIKEASNSVNSLKFVTELEQFEKNIIKETSVLVNNLKFVTELEQLEKNNKDGKIMTDINESIKNVNESIKNFKTIIEQPRHIYYVNDV